MAHKKVLFRSTARETVLAGENAVCVASTPLLTAATMTEVPVSPVEQERMPESDF